jgi:fucose permease
MQFAGSFVGVGLSSFLLSSRGFRFTIFLGYLCMAAGVAALVSNNSSWALAAAAVYGAGYGLVVPGTNLFVAEQAGQKQSSALSLLNMAWSVGSLICPVIIQFGIRINNLNSLLLGISAMAAVLSILVLISREITHTHNDTVDGISPVQTKVWPAAFFLGILFFTYVGTESAVSGWSAAFSKRLPTAGANSAELAPMFFWTGLLAGRLLAPAILSRIKEAVVVTLGLLATMLGVAIFIRSENRALAMSGLTLSGFGLSMLYPIYIAWLATAFGARARRISGPMFAMASIGGATLPSLVGVVSSFSGSLRVGLLVPIAGCALMLLTAFVFRRSAAI